MKNNKHTLHQLVDFLCESSISETEKQRLRAMADKYEQLRLWRNNIASSKNIPAYTILHNKTLLELAVRNPQYVWELHDVRGMGPMKILQYGDQVIKTLAS